MVFFILFAIPLLVAVGAFILSKGITWKEFLAQVAAQAVVAITSALICSCVATHDVETLNGVVTGKERNRVSCSHSYPCNCRQVSCGKDCTTTTCDTCYEHSWDYDWDVYTSFGETVTINRVDRQGVREPHRWTVVKIGEPVSLPHSYTNYVKAAPDSLFRHQGLKDKYASQIPNYPDRYYDYYRLDHLVTVGVSVTDAKAWNDDLAKLNSELGSPKQVNIIVVLVRNQPREYYYALEEAWVGGKKNDAILVVSLDDANKPQWAQVMAWTVTKDFEVKLRDDVMDEPVLDRTATMRILYDNVQRYFKRKPMKDYEYLKSAIVPSTTAWVVSILIGLLVSGGLTYLFHTQDLFDGRGFRRGFRGVRKPWSERIKDWLPKWRRRKRYSWETW